MIMLNINKIIIEATITIIALLLPHYCTEHYYRDNDDKKMPSYNHYFNSETIAIQIMMIIAETME